MLSANKLDLRTLRRGELIVWGSFILSGCALSLVMHGWTTRTSELTDFDSLLNQDPKGGSGFALSGTKGWRLNLNVASESELALLPEIGMRRAKALVQARRERGEFQSIWEISEVPGMTPTLAKRLQSQLRVGPSMR